MVFVFALVEGDVIPGLRLAFPFGEACGLETGNCKTREILHFPRFLLHSLTEETGYKRPELGFLKGLVS